MYGIAGLVSSLQVTSTVNAKPFQLFEKMKEKLL